MVSLADFKVGEKGRVISLQRCSLDYRHKLLAMGVTPGIEFILERVAPLGDPVVLNVRGFTLSLRKKETLGLKIEKISV